MGSCNSREKSRRRRDGTVSAEGRGVQGGFVWERGTVWMEHVCMPWARSSRSGRTHDTRGGFRNRSVAEVGSVHNAGAGLRWSEQLICGNRGAWAQMLAGEGCGGANFSGF